MTQSATTRVSQQFEPDTSNTEVTTSYRVWPDGTVQSTEDGAAYTWMSDDYIRVEARSEDEALWIALQREAK